MCYNLYKGDNMERTKEIVKISIQGIVVNILLVIFKSIIGFISNSIAIILDAVNNLSDVLSSVITIVGTALANKKPDKEHPYGHGRAEYFASVIIGVIVLLAGVTSFKESIIKIIKPEKANYTTISLVVVIVAIFVKFFFGTYVKNKGKKLNSGSLVASGVDAISDSFLSTGTLIAAIISLIFNLSLEGYFGLIISTFILKTSIEILKETIDDMLGVRADSELTKKLRKKIISYDKVEGVYDLTLHNYGPSKIIGTANIQVNDNITAKEIHRITRRIIVDIFNEYGIILTIGIYASNDTGKNSEIKKYLMSLAKKYKNLMQVHGFYVDEEINMISFDVIFNFDEENPYFIIEEIKDKLKEKYPKYEYNVILDTDFSD